MERTQSREGRRELSDEHGRALLGAARASIEHGFRTGAPLGVSPARFPPELRARRATFVTIRREGALLGCIGSLEPRRPLVEDVAANAFAAAFRDPRCPRLTPGDLARLELHISILSRPAPMAFASEEELVRQLRPGVDGLILEDGFSRGTFLPAVWDSLPDPRDFVAHLKLKAGLPPTYWSDTLRVSRYTTETIP